MLNDVHSICGYLIANYLLEKCFPERPHRKTAQRERLIVHNNDSTSTVVLGGAFGDAVLPPKARTPPGVRINQLSLLNDRIRERVMSYDSMLKKFGSEKSGNALVRMAMMLWRSMRRISKFIANHWSLWNVVSLCGDRIQRFFKNLTFRQRYLIAGVLLGSLPDLDIFLGRMLGGHHHFHRTITHSVYGNMVIIPVASAIVQVFIGKSGMRTYGHCIILVTLCVLSHLITDFITNYGTGLLYPNDKKLYSAGLITVFDLTTVMYFYAVYILSYSGIIRQSIVLPVAFLGFLALMVWKRAMLSEAYSKTYHYIKAVQRKNEKSAVWLHPSTLHNGRFYVLQYDQKTKLTHELKMIQVPRILSLIRYVTNDLLRLKQEDYRRPSITRDMGKALGQCSPRSYFSLTLYQENKPLFMKMVKEALPTLGFMGIFWLLRIVVHVRQSH